MVKKPNRNNFDLSHDHKLSIKMGGLYPILTQEVVPGDRFNITAESMLRMAPMIAPIMHKVQSYMHFFFVPNRLLWKNWEKFITNNNGDVENLPAHPVFTQATVGPRTLANYLGYPVTQGTDKLPAVSALPFMAYWKIWADYYRDQNLQPIDGFQQLYDDGLPDGFVDESIYLELRKLRNRAWEHDYFTACLPFAQKGPEVPIPISFDGVNFDVGLKPVDERFVSPIWRHQITPPDLPDAGNLSVSASGTTLDQQGHGLYYDPGDWLRATGSNSGNVTSSINDLRTAMAVQRWAEKNARGGSRYVEYIFAHFGVKSSDARLQRPEYIGGTKGPVAISEVLQTTPATVINEEVTTPQGNMAGHGIGVFGTNSINYFAEEHGFIIGIMSVLPTTAYFQGIPRMFSKFDPMDYLQPDFAHLGEQAVLNKEIYNDVQDGKNDEIFGYIPRYAEMRYNPSRVSGDFVDTLQHWHMARKFDGRPVLNDQFVVSQPTTRIFAVDGNVEDHIYAHVFFKINALRPLPMFGIPM